jgi:hypothetical protein
MMAKDKDGTWKEVTDPAVMARCLNRGESFYPAGFAGRPRSKA